MVGISSKANTVSAPRLAKWPENKGKLICVTSLGSSLIVEGMRALYVITNSLAKKKHIERPFTLIEEEPHCSRDSPVVRVEKMFEQIRNKLPGVLLEKKIYDIYGPWKKKCLSDYELGSIALISK